MEKTNNIQQKITEIQESGLTPIQEQTAILLASGKSITEVSETLNINRTTIYQWKNKVTFQCFFNFQRAESKELLRNGLFALYEDAFNVIKESLSSDNPNPTTRLKAAMWIIQKVDSSIIGNTDPRKVLQKACTTKEKLFSWDEDEEKEVFDTDKYQKLLKENDLKE